MCEKERKAADICKLENPWIWWRLKKDRDGKWQQFKEDTTVTLADLFILRTLIKPPSQFKPNSGYAVFKDGILPEWQHPANVGGGRWVIIFRGIDRIHIDHMWITALYTVVGKTLMNRKEVCGILFTIGPAEKKISIWTTDAESEHAILNIGYMVKARLGLGRIPMRYFLNNVTNQNGGIAKYNI